MGKTNTRSITPINGKFRPGRELGKVTKIQLITQLYLKPFLIKNGDILIGNKVIGNIVEKVTIKPKASYSYDIRRIASLNKKPVHYLKIFSIKSRKNRIFEISEDVFNFLSLIQLPNTSILLIERFFIKSKELGKYRAYLVQVINSKGKPERRWTLRIRKEVDIPLGFKVTYTNLVLREISKSGFSKRSKKDK